MGNKRPALKTRVYSDWRIDIDYWDKLDPEETQWLIEFLDSYYHPQGNNHQRRDIVTLTADQAAALLKPNPERNPSYTQADYWDTSHAIAQSTRQRPRDWDDESDEFGAGS